MQPCTDRHEFDAIALPDGRFAIVCARCGERADVIDAAPPAPQPVWVVPYWQPVSPGVPPWHWQPYSGDGRTITIATAGANSHPVVTLGRPDTR